MLVELQIRLRRSFEKNVPEVRAFLTRQMPAFVTQPGGSTPVDEIPVFVFHEVAPRRLETQLLYLRSNSYCTLDADELEAVAKGGIRKEREVALTFDDATFMESAVRRELTESRKILEERLVGKEVHHFCYPWVYRLRDCRSSGG
jgi:hypothetical protein